MAKTDVTDTRPGWIMPVETARFRRLTALEVIDLYEEGDEVLARLKEEHADVFADEAHPRRASVALRIRILGEIIPAIRLAWAGGCPMDLAQEPYEELLAYAKEVRRVNPFLEHLPAPDDPNPTQAAS